MIDFGDDKIFIENYQKLKSSRKMAELYGCNRTSITNHAKKIGYDYSGNKELKITAIPIEQVILDYEELKSAQKVGKKYNCSSTAVLNYLKANGYNPQNANQKLTNIVSDEDFCKNYDELKSAEKMAKLYNCSSTAILNHAKKINYEVNSNKQYKLSETDKQEIINSYYDTSSTELAEKFNVSRGMITKIWYDNELIGKETTDIKTTEIDLKNQQFGYWTVLEKSSERSASGCIMWRCRCICGTEKLIPSNTLRNGLSLSCGCKNISRGNEQISLLLQKYNIPFEREYKFSSCKDKKELPFDFFVDHKYLIEFDGIQHYRASSDPNSWNTEEKLIITKYHDEIKTNWCIENSIPLIRIPYTHLNKITIEDLKLETSKFIIMPTIN